MSNKDAFLTFVKRFNQDPIQTCFHLTREEPFSLNHTDWTNCIVQYSINFDLFIPIPPEYAILLYTKTIKIIESYVEKYDTLSSDDIGINRQAVVEGHEKLHAHIEYTKQYETSDCRHPIYNKFWEEFKLSL